METTMTLTVLSMVAAMLAPGSAHAVPATVDMHGPAGAELRIDDRIAGRFDGYGRMVVLLSAEPHRLTVMQGDQVVWNHTVTFGPGTKASLDTRE
jgi:hypothetical protein